MAAVRNLAIGVLAEQDRSMPPRSGSTAATSTDPWRPSDQARIKRTSRKTPEPWTPWWPDRLSQPPALPVMLQRWRGLAAAGRRRPRAGGSVLLGAADCVGSERLIANA
jgi:hypothetical protein